MTTPAKILFIDDDKNFRDVTAYALRRDGYEVTTAANGREALDCLADVDPDAILCDLKMPTMGGMELLAALAERGLTVPVIVITAFGTIGNAVEAMRAGAMDYITKPVNRDELDLALRRVMHTRRLERENRRLRERLVGELAVDRLIGASPAMAELRATLRRLAESDAAVLLRGESGVGKELAARALHFDGPRASAGLFVVLNCAAVPGELLESELFGHRKGSFTGAHADQIGKFVAADGGTLFLDEIGDMPIGLQAKLLRALQDGEVTPVGASASRRVDVRVVAATNQPLEERIERGEFRRDLYYRLAVVPVALPALRERPGDVEPLLRHFLARYGAPEARVAPEALAILRRHAWPGNVRELENVAMRACALRPGLGALEAGDLPPTLAHPGAADAGAAALLGDGPLRLPDGGLAFDELERRLLEAAWRQGAHSQTEGARLLGLPRQAFIYRLQKHGIIPGYGKRARGGDDE